MKDPAPPATPEPQILPDPYATNADPLLAPDIDAGRQAVTAGHAAVPNREALKITRMTARWLTGKAGVRPPGERWRTGQL